MASPASAGVGAGGASANWHVVDVAGLDPRHRAVCEHGLQVGWERRRQAERSVSEWEVGYALFAAPCDCNDACGLNHAA